MTPSGSNAPPIHLCVFEDRPSMVNGLKLCLLSIKQHLPSAVTHTFDTPLLRSLKGWLEGRGIPLVIHPEAEKNRGWSIKPFLLGYLLDTGLPSVVWLDADVIVTGPLEKFLNRQPDTTVVATEEPRSPFDPAKERAQVWGDVPTRKLPATLNSALVKVGSAHRELVRVWQERVSEQRYLDAQQHPAATRPVALFGDQDVLEGLLIGRFAEVPVTLMKNGSEIIQDFWMHDYSIADRVKSSVGWHAPLLIHGQSHKPWDLLKPGAALHPLRPYREIGAYVAAAREYRKELDDPGADYWLFPSTFQGKLINWLTIGSPHLSGAILSSRDHSHHFYRRTRAWLWNKISRALPRKSRTIKS